MENNDNITNEIDENERFEVSVLNNIPPRIGDIAPLFNATSTFGPIKLSDFSGKWLIFFSHPGDFTPVCTTEFLAFERMKPEFDKRNCSLLGLSVDSNPSHLAWVHNIHKNSGVKISFPIISDLNMKIAQMYGMIAPNESTTKTVRHVFFIDPNQKIRAILQYPMTTGRNIAEIIRLLDSLQIHDKDGVMTPANWFPGQPCLLPPPQTYEDIMNNINNPNSSNCMDWYLCFNKDFTPMPMYQDANNMFLHSMNNKFLANQFNNQMNCVLNNPIN